MKAKMVWALAAVCIFLLFKYHRPLQEAFQSLLDRIAGLGPWAPLVFILIYIVDCIFVLPSPLLAAAAGILFGVFKGTLWVVTGSILGATAAFMISRYAARSWVIK